MKKNITIIFILLAITHLAIGQDNYLTSAIYNLSIAKDDTSRVDAMNDLIGYYKLIKPDSALIYGYKALELARKIKYSAGEFNALEQMIITQDGLGNNSKALQLIFQANKIADKNKNPSEKAALLLNKGLVYEHSKDYTLASSFYKEAKKIYDSINDSIFSPFAQFTIGNTYSEMHQLDSALYFLDSAYKKASRIKDNWTIPYILLSLGKVHTELGNANIALAYLSQTIIKTQADNELISTCYLAIAQLYQKTGKQDSAIFYAGKSLNLAKQSSFYNDIIEANLFLSKVYEKDDFRQSLYYSKQAIVYKDSLNSLAQSTTQEAFTNFDEHERQQEIEDAKAEFKNRLRIYTFIGITFTLLIIAVLLYRSSRLKQRSKQNIEKAYEQLKSTQAQLIQSEKMASLGELTAGIAHEIQNPLNFVNNFSEVNDELIEELQSERAKVRSETDEKLQDEIINDIKQNLEKINHHGKRADAIVKGMLQHSRQSAGKKELTDINALCDEYLRLSYHGLRAKDKSFNADFKTDFDESIGKINIVPQDIGRVLLNLFNNAFYAVNEKTKNLSGLKDLTGLGNYKPLVSVRTKKINDKVEIRVTDNGNGIPKNIVDKIFQPFFTTKPTGSGTGLGLSLAYDIVKAHGGEMKVETKEEEETTFIIQLPIN